jgi:hypothetical protein
MGSMSYFAAQNADPAKGHWTGERLSDVDPVVGS